LDIQLLHTFNGLYTLFTLLPVGQWGFGKSPPFQGDSPPPQWGTNGRCSTIVEESNGLTNGLSFLLQKFDAQKIKVVG
jgi:hypothetical protein